MRIFVFLLLININVSFSQNGSKLMEHNSVYFVTDSILKIDGVDTTIKVYKYFKILNDSQAFVSFYSLEKPTQLNIIVSEDRGYYGKIKSLKGNSIKLVYRTSLFNKIREIYTIKENELELIKYVPEGSLFFQWKKLKQPISYFLIK